MDKFSINRGLWLFWIYLIRTCGLPFQLAPVKCPQNEVQRIKEACGDHETIIIFNAGGWGETSLEQTVDFAPILNGIQQTLSKLGCPSVIIPYQRTVPGLMGKISGTKEQLNSFRNTWKVQVRDINNLLESFPHKHFILVGFSVGGGLSGRTLKNISHNPNLSAITVGAPGWYRTYSSENSLVLNNRGQDPIAGGDVMVIGINVFKSPFRWLRAKLTGQNLSVALSLQFPNHDYSWSSEEVGAPIIKFLEKRFKRNN